ncbi:MAG: hypothetical protein HC769_05365 [Cyanobacteria bacterium CRU_2_1]|nr:hypothetical protein [Cyanobacteria bacterium RU_5_0]NJR58326.1 hypothetical protein [Cyanobacteria bacterium CRU_2_1]
MNTNAAINPYTQASPEQIVNRILASGKITAADRAWFMKAAIDETILNQHELTQVRQVSDRLRMGLLKVVD